MIRIEMENATHRACIYCDHCNQRITDVASASVVWPLTRGGAAIRTCYPQYVHKQACHGATEARLRGQGYGMGSAELRTHLRQLQDSLSAAGSARSTSASVQQVAPPA
jgi:hypothetical protein